MKDLDDALLAISRYLTDCGYGKEVIDYTVSLPDNVGRLAALRQLMLDNDFPIEDVRRFDR